MELVKYSENDVGRNLARRAHNGTSHTPEKRGDHVIDSYLAHMRAVEEEFGQWATDDNLAEMQADLEAYRAKYAELLRAYLSSHANCISAFIVGPARFPTRRAEKLNRWADNHRDRWLEFSKKRLERLRRKYDPRRIAAAPITSDDPEAVDKLLAKIKQAEETQRLMKAANKVIRKKNLTDEEKVAAVVELGLTETTARGVIEPDYMGRVGFPHFQLSNNNANIRRMKQRVEELKRKDQDVTKSEEMGNGVEVVDNVEDNRVQVFFPGKPAADIRAKLKGRGFRWAPSVGAWQRHRSDYALQLGREIAKEYER